MEYDSNEEMSAAPPLVPRLRILRVGARDVCLQLDKSLDDTARPLLITRASSDVSRTIWRFFVFPNRVFELGATTSIASDKFYMQTT